MTEGLQALHGADTSLPLVLTVYSLGLHATSLPSMKQGLQTASHCSPTPRLLRIGRNFRYPVDTWTENIADALTKRNPVNVSRADLDLLV